MAARTDKAQVWGVLQAEDRPDPDYELEPFIAAAHAVVDGGFGSLQPETTLTLIETFLAAHFFVISKVGKAGVTRVEILDAAESYATGADLGEAGELSSTGYGRVALALSGGDELETMISMSKPAARIIHVA
jgi:hypothetical protein